ncbi:MAG TPA: prepilin-type N-terminal cleavage/methylation domain-containing protein [Candidatus Microsaccharimonas sp.]|jgi:general secretion pathway protein G
MPKYRRGFTIVELLIVIVVIGILAAITIIAFNGVRMRAVEASMKSDLVAASKILGIDYVNNTAYPATTASANSGKGLTSSNGSTYTYTPNNSSTVPSFILMSTNSGSTNRYYVTNTNSSPALVTGAPPVITAPTTSSVTNSDGCGGGYWYLGLYSTATGTPTPTVQWQRLSTKNTTTGTWIDITGATTSLYSFNSQGILFEPDYLVFRAVWTSGIFTTTSPTLQIALTNGC